MMTHGRMLGSDREKLHHLFVWPGFALCIVFVGWRLFRGGPILQRGARVYLAGMSIVSVLMVGSGYSGGEMLFDSNKENVLPSSDRLTPVPDHQSSLAAGQQLFLKNCAHCHGADAHGDDGPDLHNLDSTDEQVGMRIRNGKKGQMTAFAGKFSPQQIRDVIGYLRSLK
jgi:mono/diheme cytochrome c family protein